MSCTQIYSSNFKKLSSFKKPKCEITKKSASNCSTLSLTNATVCTHKSWNSLSMFQLKTTHSTPFIVNSSSSSSITSTSNFSSKEKENKNSSLIFTHSSSSSSSSLVKNWLQRQHTNKTFPQFSSAYQKNIYVEDFSDLSLISSSHNNNNNNYYASSFLTNSTNISTLRSDVKLLRKALSNGKYSLEKEKY